MGDSGRRAVLPLGASALDDHLPGGGLPLAGLHEIAGERAEWDDGAALGFALVLLSRVLAARPGPVLWVAARLDLYAPGLAAAGLDAGRLILARGADEAARLWALEEGLRAGAFAALLGELAALDRIAGRRLQLAAETAGLPCFVLQRQLVGQRRAQAPSAALTRWRVAPQPSSPFSVAPILEAPHSVTGQSHSESLARALPPRGGRRVSVAGKDGSAIVHDSAIAQATSITDASAPHPAWGPRAVIPPSSSPEAPAGSPEGALARLPGRLRWRVELLRCRGAAPATFSVEWNDASGDFGLVAPLRDGSLDREPAAPRVANQSLRRLAG